MKQYIVKCSKHYPYYELIYAESIKDAEEQCLRFKGCKLDFKTLKLRIINDNY